MEQIRRSDCFSACDAAFPDPSSLPVGAARLRAATKM